MIVKRKHITIKSPQAALSQCYREMQKVGMLAIWVDEIERRNQLLQLPATVVKFS